MWLATGTTYNSLQLKRGGVATLFFGDFGVSFVATVAGRYTRRGGPRLSVQGEPLIVLTREPFDFCVVY